MVRRFSFPLRLAAIPLLLGLVVYLELKHPLPYFRLLTFVSVFALLADLASLARGKSRDFLLVLASLAFGISLIEAGANILEPKTSISMTRGWSVRQPIIGWGPEHPGQFHAQKWDPKTGAEIYNADYTIDANLLRQTKSCEAGPTIVFFGCSFTFGDGVADSETMPQVFADALDRKQRVLNLGFTGYGPQQFLREMETGLFDSVIGPQPTLFIFLTAAWHAERTACKSYWTAHAPLYALENDQIVFKGACNEGASLWLREWLENTALYRVTIEPYRHKVSHDDIDLYIRVLLAAVNLAKQKYGVPTLIPYLRVEDDYLKGTGFNDETIIKRLQDGGAYVVDASLAKEEAEGAIISMKGDGHPTPFAHRVRASLLKDYVQRHMSGLLTSRAE
ncbi:SGNH/GDSL hydrolase family protein [Methylocapsa polymorpha]|uniref:SGNH/GDSL hydrolase family protein n=1 Tax=Methylocapsa polymorpha TaxID=3080828 RepID=A0ABZ0HR58_9HYPH|nr:SGNH/GDSL hydrolase family protein [Methylocapsa sp. RX1]